MQKLFLLDELDSCAKLAKADIIPWEKGDARFNVLTALLIAAGKLDLELYWNLERGELLLKNKYYSTNLGAGSSEAILNAALALDFIATSSQIKSLTQEEERQKAEQRERGRNMQTSEMSVEEAATLKKLVKRAKQINNMLFILQEDGAAQYLRRQSPRGVFLVSNAYEPDWKHFRPGPGYVRRYVFDLPNELPVLEKFIACDEELYQAWCEKQ